MAVISLLAAQDRSPEPTQVVRQLDCCVTGMEQPVAESPTREGKRTATSHPYGTPQVDLRHMLEGNIPQDIDEMLFRGIRKLTDPTQCQKEYTMFLIKVAPDSKDWLN